MRKLLLLFVVLISVCGANPEMRSHNVVIHNPTGECQGSGVIIEQGILTAAHVVDGATTVNIQYFGETITETELVRKVDKKLDLALVSCSRRNSSYSKIANLEPQVDEEIYTVSSGTSHFFSVKHGRISNIEDEKYILDLSVYPGDSGGPVYNKNNEVIGVVQAIDIVYMGPARSAYAERLEQVKKFLYE